LSAGFPEATVGGVAGLCFKGYRARLRTSIT
jgi:hypothetical protein